MTDYRNEDESNGTERADPPSRAASRAAAGSDDLPPVLITFGDGRRLRALLADARRDTDASVRRFLLRELDRAVLCQPDLMPSNVVTMNSRVFFRRHIGQPIESRTLVYDDSYLTFGETIPVLTPLGVALLGLRAGSKMPYLSRQGVRFIAHVEQVAYQPEAEGRLVRAPGRYWPSPRQAPLDAQRRFAVSSPRPDQDTVVPFQPRLQPRLRRARPRDDDDDPGPIDAA